MSTSQQKDGPLTWKVGEILETLNTLFKLGVGRDDLKNIRSSSFVAERVAQLIKKRGHYLTSSEIAIEAILGNKYFGPSDWNSKIYDKVFSKDIELPEDFEEILNQPCPFTENKLVMDTHFLFCMPGSFYENIQAEGLSAATYAKLICMKEGPSSSKFRWLPDLSPGWVSRQVVSGYHYKKFDTVTPKGWYLFYQDTYPDNLFKTREKVNNNLPQGYRIATMLEAVLGRSFFSESMSYEHQPMTETMASVLEEDYILRISGIKAKFWVGSDCNYFVILPL